MGVPVETGGGRLQAGGVSTVVTARFTRPADTTQYTANDNVGPNATTGGPIQFKDCVRYEGGTGKIWSALMFVSTDAGTNPSFDLVLFDTPNLTVAADNAAGTITDSELTNAVFIITFDGTVAANTATVGPNLIIGASNVGQLFKCAPNTRDLWAVVVDRGGYTPASAETFTFKIGIEQD